MPNEDSLKQLFASGPAEGPSKVTGLDEAIAAHLKPGQSVFLGWNAASATCEIMRRFRGQKPGFTFIMTMTWDHALNLVHCGLAQKLVSTNCSYAAPSPAPSHAIQRAFRKGTVQIENWSLYSIQQRLMAGALGVGFMPTHSISESSMALDNRDSFAEIPDPFNPGAKIGAVKALNPDIAIVHALAADHNGNAIMSPVSQDTLWGAKASTGGVLVTCEKIVPADFIRRHSYLPAISGYLVRSVSLCPLGAHPEGHFSNLSEVDSYGEDYDFMLGQRQASADEGMLDEWLDKWVYGVKGHDGYLERLGAERVSALKRRFNKKYVAGIALPGTKPAEESKANGTEAMIAAASRKIAEHVKEKGYNVVLAGIGLPGLAAWMAYYKLKSEGINVDLALGSGVLGYQPRPGDPNLLTVSNAPSARMLVDTSEMYGYIISGAGARCLSIIGAAQIDESGNVNTTVVGSGTYISGSGGNNDNACGAAEVMVVAAQSKRRCVQSLDYRTSRGERITTLVTSMGVFEKGPDGRFLLTGCILSQDDGSVEDGIARVRDNCGWPVNASAEVASVAPPTSYELALLRSFDPNRYLLKD